MKIGDRVEVIGPAGGVVKNRVGQPAGRRPPSAQLGRQGVVTVLAIADDRIEVRLDGESRPRNFQPADLKAV